MLEPGELLAGLDVAAEQYFPEGYFCTGFYLIADEETGLVRYAGVGHPPAIVVGPNGSRTLPSNPGMLGIGMVDGTAGATDRIGPGESLVIYTDGLTDAMDPSDALFGEERLRTLLQSHYGADPAEILNQVDDGAQQAHIARAARPTTSTSSFSSISPSECSPSLPGHVKLNRGVEGPDPAAIRPFCFHERQFQHGLGPLNSFLGRGWSGIAPWRSNKQRSRRSC